MNILLTNTTLCNFYGSQLFTYTLAKELHRQGHNVYCFTTRLGKVAELLKESGIQVTDDLTTISNDIDIIHAHHRHESLLAFAAFQQTPMVLVCHGVLPWQEQPFRAAMNIRKFVAVSEEVRDHLVCTHGIPEEKIRIIRNGIDLERFACRKAINPTLQKLLVLSNHSADEQLKVIQQACKEMEVDFTKIGFPAQNVWNVEDYINEADLVVTLGRGVLEAVACKRVVVVYDYNGADGLVTKDTFPLFRQKSFSGRTNRLQYTVDEFKGILAQYSPKIADEVYQYVSDVSVARMASRYVSLYEEVVADPLHRPPEEASRALFYGITELIKDFRSEARSADSLDAKKREIDELTERLLESERQRSYLSQRLSSESAAKQQEHEATITRLKLAHAADIAELEQRLTSDTEELKSQIAAGARMVTKLTGEIDQIAKLLQGNDESASSPSLNSGNVPAETISCPTTTKSLEGGLGALSSQLPEIKRQLQLRLHELQETKDVVAILYNSKSWKITAPLRLFKRFVDKL